jgi:SAM-dependent methyltransferase
MALARVWNLFTDLVGSLGLHAADAPVGETTGGPAAVVEDLGGPSGPTLPASTWGRDRVAVVQSLWGDGFTFPDGEEETLRLARPLGLSNASSLLLVGVGAGGPACSIAAQLGPWVTGFEADPDLAVIAAEHSARGGFGRRAEIKTWDPAEPNFSRRSFHHALTLQALQGAPPGPVLVALFRALRPGGQLVMVDVVADDPLDPADEQVNAWCRLEHRSPGVPSERVIAGALLRLGFDVRVTEDISLRHMHQALRGWHGAIRGMHNKRPSPAVARVVVREAELWLRRLSLMRTHRIRLVRWHAIRGAGA